MIAKVITLSHSSGSKGFDPVMRYVMRVGPEHGLADDVGIEAGHMNVAEDQLEYGPNDEREAYAGDLACVFNNLDHACRKKGRFDGNPVYHVAINWQEGEHPTPEQAAFTCDYVMKALGYADHQAAWAIHRDTDNDHVHLIVNRVHPETLKAVSPPFKKDFLILDRCMRELEIEFGHQRANGPYITLDTDDGQKIVRMSRAERRERGLLKEDDKRITDRAKRSEKNMGDEQSFQSWVGLAPAADMKRLLAGKDASWQDVHASLARHGVSIQPKGSGMVVTTMLTDGRVLAAKASQMGRWASRAELEKRLGPFEPPHESVALRPMYQQQVVDQRSKERSDGVAISKRDPDERALRRQARADAREELAKRFGAEQEAVRTDKAEVRQQLKQRHQQERRELLLQMRATRQQARADARAQGNSELVMSLWAYHAALQREDLQKRQAEERRRLTARIPRNEVWRIWLEKQAAQGDEAVLAALRGIRYREQRAKNKAVNGIEGEEIDPLRRHTLAALDAVIDQRRQLVIYRGRDGREKFTDTGPRIVMQSIAEDSLDAGLRLAAQKYGGRISITGSSEFREQAARQAVRLGITVTNDDLKAVVADEQAKRSSAFNQKDFTNERPDYERINRKQARAGQRAAALYQSGTGPAGTEVSPRAIAGLRNLSGVGLVHHQPAQVFLQPDAPDRVGQGGIADPEMRRTGTGATETGHGTGELTGKISTESVENRSDKADKPMNEDSLVASPKKRAVRPKKDRQADFER